MNSLRNNYAAKALALFALALFVLPIHTGISAAAETTTTIAIKHKPIQYFVPDKRIKIDTEVTDKEAIKLVRCYFRAAGEAGYVFVPMAAGKEGVFESILPAPGKNTKTLEYLFLVVNEKNQIVRSQVFIADKKDDDKTPAWQQVTSEGDIHVSTELANAPTPPGFNDSIVLDVVESGARFGLVAEGIYLASEITAAGSATGTAAASTSAGVVTASSGMSTMAIVGIGAAVAAVAGGAAAAAGSGGGGGDDPPPPQPPINASATISWGDSGPTLDDSFKIWFAGQYLGESPRGGAGQQTVSGLMVGTYDLKIEFSGQTGSDYPGTYFIQLGGGAKLTSGETKKDGSISNIGESLVFSVVVPKP